MMSANEPPVGSTTVWEGNGDVAAYPQLKSDVQADVCVVGAGIAGLSTAYLLTQSGKTVVVIEDGAIASGETGRTTAHLSNALGDRYFDLERLHGEEGIRSAAASHSAAIDQIESIVAQEQIDCEFQRLDGYLFLPPGEPASEIDEELQAAHRAGLAGVERVQRAPLAFYDTGPALRFPRQAQFHPRKYLAGLARAIVNKGGRIFTGTHATKIAGGAPASVDTRHGPKVTADAVVVATNTPVNDLVAIHTKQAAYLTYVIGVRIPTGSVTRALYWDTGSSDQGRPVSYHYIRLQGLPPVHQNDALSTRDELLIVGGEDHKTGQANDAPERYARLEAWTRARFPMAKNVEYRWSGQVLEPVDGVAFIGRNPMDAKNVYVATGDSGNGMTHGTIAGILLTDLICGRENPWAALYNPSRITLSASLVFARENLNVAGQYFDWIKPSQVNSTDEIAPGAGAVIRRGVHRFAAYRDEHNQVHECSAVCPHLGCLVAWNDAEKTWDCPCHGSRFDAYGGVINGPANTDLATIHTPVKANE